MKKVIILSIILALALSASVALAGNGNGFDEFGYNTNARNFVGACVSWHMGKLDSDVPGAEAYCRIYAHDKLVMKWNKA